MEQRPIIQIWGILKEICMDTIKSRENSLNLKKGRTAEFAGSWIFRACFGVEGEPGDRILNLDHLWYFSSVLLSFKKIF